jgi:hypothetical protein
MATQTLTAENTLFFLCNGEEDYDGEIYNDELTDRIKAYISEGSFFKTQWSAWNSRFIQVGDRAYLLRSSDSRSNDPKGIIAAGKIIAAPPDQQLRNQYRRFSDLSEAYIDQYGDRLYVYIQIDSVVDFDSPLERQVLRKNPKLKDVNFNFGRGGARFAPNNPDAINALAEAWRSHSLDCQVEGKGRRLSDVLIKEGDKATSEGEDEAALAYYQEALEIDPGYQKAISREANCQARINRKNRLQDKGNEPTPAPIKEEHPEPDDQQTSSDELDSIREQLAPEPSTNAEEERRLVLTYIARRQGQPQFRQALLDAYDSKCAITGFDAEAALEAAHIIPYAETENNAPTNGILLRADLHTLFDLNLLAIDPDTLRVSLHPTLQHTEYRPLHGKQIQVPQVEALRPDKKYLAERLQQCTWMNAS